MNTTPVQPDSNERNELARLLPAPVERDLPSDRHLRIQELVMSHIHQDLQTAEQAPRHAPKRRLVLLASALTAATAVAAVVIGTGGFGGSGGGSVPAAAPALTGQQILLAAATVAERTPEGSGTYWHVTLFNGVRQETWTQRDGQGWWRWGNDEVTKVTKTPGPTPFRLWGTEVSFEQLQTLPTEPDALKAWIADAVKRRDVRPGVLDPTLVSLVSLVTQLPAPPKVRAAAFQAIASYPNVKSLGAVKGGQSLELSSINYKEVPARLVVDPATSQITETNFFVAGGVASGPNGDWTIAAEWTNELPK